MFSSSSMADTYSKKDSILLNTSTLKVKRIKSNRLIFISNIDKNLNEKGLNDLVRRHLSKCRSHRVLDDLEEVQFVCDPIRREYNRGYCFLRYGNTASAILSKSYLKDNLLLGDKSIIVDWADEFNRKDLNLKQLHISGIHKGITTNDIIKCFSTYGKIDNIKLARDLSTKGRLDYGFVSYERTDEAKNALDNFQWRDFFSSEIKISYARTISAIIRHRENDLSKKLLGSKRQEKSTLQVSQT